MSIKQILLIAFIFIIEFAHAQHANSIKFSRLTIKDGLSQSTVNCILQDNQGYIWGGTQAGLNRFDGYHFKIYKQGLDSDNSLTNDYMDFMNQNGVINQSFINGTFLGDDIAFCNEIRSAIEITLSESKKQ